MYQTSPPTFSHVEGGGGMSDGWVKRCVVFVQVGAPGMSGPAPFNPYHQPQGQGPAPYPPPPGHTPSPNYPPPPGHTSSPNYGFNI